MTTRLALVALCCALFTTSSRAPAAEATPVDQITVLPGFKIERLYSVPKEAQGSWVSMTNDPKGRLIVSDQYGPLYRVTVGATPEDTKVEKLTSAIGMAQGLLFAHDSLYVVVSDPKGIANRSSGLYRLMYDAATDSFGEPKLLAAFQNRTRTGGAGGEHGPHTVRLGPDGKLYVVAGNFTSLPDGVVPASPVRNYAEDLLLPRNPDGGGHDPTIWAPGGWVCRTDADGKTWEAVVSGMRNTYDFDFNADGELFGYDSDMEWDTGTPWYRPTRLLLGATGAEFGWRNGTGKWPDYYPDSLPAVVNTGMGSPTGVTFGYKAKFPAKYQQAMFLVDWAYGKVYAAHITPEGAGYKATFEPFIEAKGFDGTDVVIGNDGAMYLAIGGRRTQSGLYRVTYTGSESTAAVTPPANPQAAEARAIRRKLEAFQGKPSPDAVETAWPYLGSPDRYLRFAAMRALEWQDASAWQSKALAEKRPTALVYALTALVRSANPAKVVTTGQPTAYANEGDAALRAKVLGALNALNLRGLSEEQLLETLRVYGLTFIRLGKPTDEEAKQLAARLDPLYPAPSFNANRELGQLLAHTQAPSVVEKSMRLLASAQTQEEQLHYVMILRVVKAGWTPEARKAYFSWINFAEKNYKGGASFKRFLQRIRQDATQTLTPDEQKTLAEILKGDTTAVAIQQTAPRQFVRNWQMRELADINAEAIRGRNFEKGKAAFDAVGCIKCHRFGNEGGATGPDLTGVGNRFQPADVLEATLLPSKAISDQYQAVEIRTTDGDVFLGTVESEDATTIRVRTNPYVMDAVAVKKADVKSRQPSKLSLMPEGLIDVLNKEEILDLVAYLRSAGNPKDKAFNP